MNKLSVLTLACAGALSACSLIPTYERPAAPIATQWPDRVAVDRADPSGVQPAWNKDWKAFYADATVQELIGIALSNNRDLRVSVLNIEQARAQLGLRRAVGLVPAGRVAWLRHAGGRRGLRQGQWCQAGQQQGG